MDASIKLFKALNDETRLQIVLLLTAKAELCVCELTSALQLSQPMVSRHLSILRDNVLAHERKGQWVYYRLSDDLAPWQKQVIELAAEANQDTINTLTSRLEQAAVCC
ncbi:metalloregulator ArsR/SmtB family transcription factor [Catenovulum sp. SM1970]|uniref:metalloregulator ArsR/SmtB family transcription factor n=1 Tax=Marinifaba aquimaris TaxID=2741323 RepID=UPI0015746210|nr:metalloregulator ArsR/SmtB family transcription factor [Marinifaba aquimaris]NTS76451.1 metalloregulator ArsR/SmtB family transcription factor [Marinifaba aquimaris]